MEELADVASVEEAALVLNQSLANVLCYPNLFTVDSLCLLRSDNCCDCCFTIHFRGLWPCCVIYLWRFEWLNYPPFSTHWNACHFRGGATDEWSSGNLPTFYASLTEVLAQVVAFEQSHWRLLLWLSHWWWRMWG